MTPNKRPFTTEIKEFVQEECERGIRTARGVWTEIPRKFPDIPFDRIPTLAKIQA